MERPVLVSVAHFLSSLPPDHAAAYVVAAFLAPIFGLVSVGFVAVHVADVLAEG